ncbi:MAG: AAA family ATPase [Proteobacteria bacterium]|nr:AAA family ATPase [Pseudomonadota bacterium]MBU4471885.1 AAA family ATPase [Pseudomonadota bacterium]MCG2752839.1 AAA family ATPase [Desulfobacteraceae bacterium]
MYLNHYNLKTEPFKITTDPEFLWLGEKHKEALATLKYGILGNKGILLLTGDVGTGKTTLIHALLNSLGEDTIVATVPDPGLDKMDFFNYVASAFNINKTFYTKGDFTLYLSHFLKTANGENKKVLLIIDEAQRLNKDLLEEIRLLSNIELQNTKLINLFFVGQKEFNDIILMEENKALRQRISLRYNIEPLNLDETREYIKYRLLVAGTKKSLFTSNAVSKIYSFSKGYPRLINILCDYALLAGFVRDKKTIGRQIVQECAEELQIPEDARSGRIPESDEQDLETEKSSPQPVPVRKQKRIDKRKSEENNQPVGFFRKAGFAALIVLLLASLGYHFYDASKARNFSEFLNHAWQKADEQIRAVAGWMKKDEIIQPDEDKAVSVAIPSREDVPVTPPNAEPLPMAQKDQSTFPVKRESIKQEKMDGTDQVTMEIPSLQSQSPAEPPNQTLVAGNLPVPIPSSGEDSKQSIDEKPVIQKEPAPMAMAPAHSEAAGLKKEAASEEKKMSQPMGIVYDKGSEFSSAARTPGESNPTPLERKPTDKAVIYFESNSFSLTGEAIQALEKIAGFSIKHPETEIVIKGYTDDSGPIVYNERLSIFRAYSVKSYLVDHGVDSMKAKAFGMGPRSLFDEDGSRIPAKMTRSAEVEMYVK